MTTASLCSNSRPALEPALALDIRGFHTAVMSDMPRGVAALPLRQLTRAADDLVPLFLRDEIAIFWPSWR
ncbi:MAG: hypothetical protein AAGC60_02140 [Acidobacteriota bacterium]